MTAASHPVVAVADLHGHLDHFDKLLARLDADLGEGWTLVTLGDYVDNGPQIPGLLDRLVELKRTRAGRFFPILGNHDLACLRAMGWEGGAPDPEWWGAWRRRYWNAGLDTPSAYGARSAAELAQKMPAHHRAFLQQLPWFHETDEYVFVHAGLEPGPAAPQLEELSRRSLLPNGWQARQLREKDLSTVSHPGWGKVVVSGHTKRPGERVAGHPNAPHFASAHRVVLSAEVDESGTLFAVVLPSRRLYRVDRGGAAAAGRLSPLTCGEAGAA